MSKKKKKKNKKLSKSKMLYLLEIYYSRLEDVNSQFTTFFTVFISSIFVVMGASVVGMVSDLEIWLELVLVCAGMIMSIILAIGLRTMGKCNFQLILETIAKINITEELLGLDNKKEYYSQHWDKSSLVLDRHVESMEETGTVENFIIQKGKKDQMGSVYYITTFIFIFASSVIVFEVVRFLICITQS